MASNQQHDPPIDVPIRDDMIRLGQFLKLAGVVEDGGEARELIERGEVTVNDAVETRRGRQLQLGDTVTVLLSENTAAQKSSSTSTSKDTSVDIPAPLFGGSPLSIGGKEISAGLQNSRSFEGSGDSSLSNRLQGNITVTVARRLSNGNLVVRGQKWIEINQGREFVRVQGVIRPIAIQPDNTIASYKVADASIAYGARGALADANRPGLLSRFFNSIWNPL